MILCMFDHSNWLDHNSEPNGLYPLLPFYNGLCSELKTWLNKLQYLVCEGDSNQ